jgi:hypothetical protein
MEQDSLLACSPVFSCLTSWLTFPASRKSPVSPHCQIQMFLHPQRKFTIAHITLFCNFLFISITC